MTLKIYTRGKLGHAPVNGKYYFVHRASRLVRVDDFHTLPVPAGWEQVSLPQWEAFRKETKKLTRRTQMELHRSYSCSSITLSPSVKSSKSKATLTKPPVKPSLPVPVAKSSPSTKKSKPKLSSRSVNAALRRLEKSVASRKSSRTKLLKTPSGVK